MNITVKIGEKEQEYHFEELWQVEWLINAISWYLSLKEGSLMKSCVDYTLIIIEYIKMYRNKDE